jgi:hypothetical protein
LSGKQNIWQTVVFGQKDTKVLKKDQLPFLLHVLEDKIASSSECVFVTGMMVACVFGFLKYENEILDPLLQLLPAHMVHHHAVKCQFFTFGFALWSCCCIAQTVCGVLTSIVFPSGFFI